MFKSNFIRLCNEKGVAPTTVCKSIGLSNAAFSAWDDFSIPRKTTLLKLANYFDVPVEYLTGKTDIKEKAPDQNDQVQDKNVLRIAGRDGSYIERKLTDEQMRAFRLMVEQLPEADDL